MNPNDNIFEYALELMQNQSQESLAKSLDNVHHKGLFSLVIGGTENGQLTRIFIATKKIKLGSIQLHSHCYDLSIGVIKGGFMHHLARDSHILDYPTDYILDWVNLDEYRYQSPLNGGNGLEYLDNNSYCISSNFIPVGGQIHLLHSDIHSVSVDKGTMWVLHEHGFQAKESKVLGFPFKTNGLYTAPKQYQVNNMWEMAYKELKTCIDLKRLKMKG